MALDHNATHMAAQSWRFYTLLVSSRFGVTMENNASQLYIAHIHLLDLMSRDMFRHVISLFIGFQPS